MAFAIDESLHFHGQVRRIPIQNNDYGLGRVARLWQTPLQNGQHVFRSVTAFFLHLNEHPVRALDTIPDGAGRPTAALEQHRRTRRVIFA